MTKETTLARDMEIYAEPALDNACKKLLSNREILALILKACCSEYTDCSVRDIAELYIENTPEVSGIPVHPDEGRIRGSGTEDKTETEGTIYYDIRFAASIPRNREEIGIIVNIEAQNQYSPGYPIMKRAIYYGSRLISAQRGVEFTHSQYSAIKKVYSIWICMNPRKDHRNSLNIYEISEKKQIGNVERKRTDYDLMQIVMICLGNSDGDEGIGIIRMLNVLLSEGYGADEKKRILQEDFGVRMTRELEGDVETMCDVSIGIQRRAILRGLKQGIEQGLEQGREQGLEQGREQGREQGLEQGIILCLINLMNTSGMNEEQAMDALKVPKEKREIYHDEIMKRG